MGFPMLRKLLIALVPIGVLLVVLQSVTLPYYAEGPGPAREVESLIRVSGRPKYDSAGRLIMTAVSFQSVNGFQAIGAWLDPARALVSKSLFLQPGETEQQANRRAISDMDQSKIDASFVVLRKLAGYPKEHGLGVLVEGVLPGCPSVGKLYPGDIISEVNGTSLAGPDAFRRALDEARPRTAVELLVRAGGRKTTVEVTPRSCDGSKRPLIGISSVPSFPFPISISSGDIGGPSAGMMWALGLYDLLTPGDLTGGRTIAGTGEIDLRGRVYPIGGVGEKIIAARRAGARVFLVPAANLAEAEGAAEDIRLIPVETIDDALRYLMRTSRDPAS
jgi:PDZ domain-containing protein